MINLKKTTISLFLVCMLLILSACTSNNKKMNDIVGKWYAESGEIAIDVREDGSYDDNGYGTGTWKYLDDGITIEFTDFYGSTKTTTIEKDEAGYSIFNGKYYKDSYPINNSEEILNENNANENLTLSIKDAGTFSSGCAWIEYNKDDTVYTGLIDKTGKLLFNKEKTTTIEKYCAIDNGLGYFFVYPDKYTLINAEGEVLSSSENGNFDAILAHGDGKALVYKKVSGITTIQHMYGIIAANGNWEYPLTDWGIEPYDFSTTSIPKYGFYANEGMFVVRIKHTMGFDDALIVFNSNTFEKFFLYEISTSTLAKCDFVFKNGFTVIGDAGNSHDRCYISSTYIAEGVNTASYNIPDNVTILPENFMLYTNGKFKEIDEFDKCVNNITMKRENNVWKIHNHNSNKSFEISDYSADNVNLKFTENFCLMTINGADEKHYFTLIDFDSGNKYFEPICYTNVSCSLESVFYRNKDSSNSYKIIDLKGEVIADLIQYEKIGVFNEGLASAQTENGNFYYIDTKGNTVITNIVI